jgi:hypothetical protein
LLTGGWIGSILILEGQDGRGWSRVSGDLSKVLAFLVATVGASSSGGLPSSGGPLTGFKVRNGTGPLTFTKVVSSAATVSAMGCRPPGEISGSRGAAKVVDVRPLANWCELEEQAIGPSGKDYRVDDLSRSRGCVGSPAGVSGDAAVEGDVSLQGDGVFGVFGKVFEFLGRLSKALAWACGFSKSLGFKSLFGLN